VLTHYLYLPEVLVVGKHELLDNPKPDASAALGRKMRADRFVPK